MGNRGLEGLAIRESDKRNSLIAVLWEGGYLEKYDVTDDIWDKLDRRFFEPIIFIHELKLNKNNVEIDYNDLSKIKLLTPKECCEPDAQRFRAPDFVWHKLNEDEWGFIVFLGSENALYPGKEYKYSWLQRFDMKGRPVGSPVDLKKLVPEKIKNANWEGLGWFEFGKSLIIVHDKPPKGIPTAFVIELPKGW